MFQSLCRLGNPHENDELGPIAKRVAILKHTFDLSDEELCTRWIENPYFQFFCGEEFFIHELPFDRSSMTRCRQRMGEGRIAALLQESLSVAVRTGAIAPKDTHRVIVDTTVQPKNVGLPPVQWAPSQANPTFLSNSTGLR